MERVFILSSELTRVQTAELVLETVEQRSAVTLASMLMSRPPDCSSHTTSSVLLMLRVSDVFLLAATE